MPTHSDLSRVSVSDLEQLTGLRRETLRKRLKAEPAVKAAAKDGRTVWYPARAALERVYLGEALDLTRERARLAKEQADKLEMENAQARGELVPGDQVEAWGVRLAGEIRTKCLAVPSRAAPAVFGLKTIAEVEATLRRFQTEALEALADDRLH
jgi:phage terminase Nu1 subunit (DNA packaging protein)